MAAQGLPCSIAGVAQAYEDFLDILVCDTRDARAAEALRTNGLRVQCTHTIMRSAEDKAALAREVLSQFAPVPTVGERSPAPGHSFSASGPPAVILVPVKNLSAAKQRLAAVLDQPSRTALAQAMLHDVLSALHGWKNRPPVAVVTSDPYAVKLAAEYGFEIIPDPENPGETGAIEMATRLCVERGVDSTLVIPADIPLIQPGSSKKF